MYLLINHNNYWLLLLLLLPTLDAVKFMTIIKLLAFLLTDCDNWGFFRGSERPATHTKQKLTQEPPSLLLLSFTFKKFILLLHTSFG